MSIKSFPQFIMTLQESQRERERKNSNVKEQKNLHVIPWVENKGVCVCIDRVDCKGTQKMSSEKFKKILKLLFCCCYCWW
jgi:hypothetical protein